jgi:4-amino-4-deoxy-L-arabinose transferase-like glycosyltransferase
LCKDGVTASIIAEPLTLASLGPLGKRTLVLRACGVAALLFIVLFWRLGTPSFWDPDEAHYAETSREVINTGDWLAPYYNEQPFFDKPMLFHWLQAGAMTLAGPTEFGARLVPALAALALILITAWLGTALVSFEVGFVAALVLAASPSVFALARYAILDTVFTACLFGGASLVTVAALKDRPRLQWGGYVLIALAVLTKGPLALVLCGISFGLAIAVSAELRRRLLALRIWSGLALVLALAAPWFVYMWLRFRGDFINGYILDENLRLFATNRFNARLDSWFYFRVLGAGLLPWTGLVIGRLFDDARGAIRERRSDPVDALLWCWVIAVVGFFTLSRFKLDHYVFPAAPALCLICARAWDDIRGRTLHQLNVGTRLGFHSVGPILVAIGAGGGYFMIARLELPAAACIVPAVMLAAGGLITARASLGNWKPPRVPWIALFACTVTYAGVIVWVLPTLEDRKVVPDVAQWVSRHSAPETRVAMFRLNRWSTAFRFYVDRHTQYLDDVNETSAFLAKPDPFYCVMLRPAFNEFVARGLPVEIVYERDGMWATSGRVLWRRRIPPTRFVVVSRKGDPQ